MHPNTEIVFLHKGYSWYLPYALFQAKSASPNSNVVLIGDTPGIKGIQSKPINTFENTYIDIFRTHYIHMSTNPEYFELFCWIRWFYLLTYMKYYDVDSVLYLDSDVFLYSSIDDIRVAYSDLTFKCVLSIPLQDFNSLRWSASGHASYWTVDILEEFCRFIIASYCDQKYVAMYKRKWDWHLSHKQPGGVCDMTTLYLFWRENQDHITNFATSHHGNVFDCNINVGANDILDQYVTESGMKKVDFIDGQPFLYLTEEARGRDRVHALHFQGAAKRHMRVFYTGKPFPGKAYCDLRYYFNLLMSGGNWMVRLAKGCGSGTCSPVRVMLASRKL